ncbi:malto-oligosyltrehalose trehalohydrolase [Glaciihabitans arcticus]|uniref:Malto-oligosyltrehalose trehalohydrolase n=1 Tax=Glaciihabitans arcticus TaxID=2668039 RepID=A0A4Q9GQL0_9MICO|nr:malto-oligosyltrehalose trehalohydrolase [Glaciihabitans arcticus]TBN57162.1 malto-oligosyltrehalose trehalohydrolase [Glaciihabitans arcticus]
MIFELWAPSAEAVSVEVDGALHPLVAGDAGWWVSRDLDLEEGDHRYGFVIDDDPTALPDPRSRRQPDGVHRLSATADVPEQHVSWTGRQLAGSVIYELHIGTFTPEGTLDSAIERLDHLVDLGIDFVEVLPVNGFNGTHNWGYDGVLWYTVHEGYGGPEAYARFVDACHERGLGVVQDVVYNHLGPSGNYLPRFGPYLRTGSANTWGDSVNLDEPAVRDYIIENALMWLRDYRVDALRLDAVHALIDDSPKHLLQQLAEEVDVLSAHLGRPLSLIAESDLNDPKLILPREAGGYGLTAQWSDDYHHSVHTAVTGETTGYYEDFAELDALAKTTTEGFFHNGTLSSFRERNHGHPIPAEVPAWRLVTFAQDHDQIGNRATGDRLSPGLGFERLAIAAVLNLCSPFTPMIFMGEEWGASTPWQFFTSHPEPELGEATAKGRIAEFAKMGWDPAVVPDPQDPATFERSHLLWDEREDGDHARLLDLYRDLIALRREYPELTDPRFSTIAAEVNGDVFTLNRGRVRVQVATADTVLEPVGAVLLRTASTAISLLA